MLSDLFYIRKVILTFPIYKIRCKSLKVIFYNVIFKLFCVIGKIEDFPITSIVAHNFPCVKLAREQRRDV